MAMLQFGGALCNALARFAPRAPWRIHQQQLLAASSSTAASPSPAAASIKREDAVPEDKKVEASVINQVFSKNPLVQAVFDSLNTSDEKPGFRPRKYGMDHQITLAKTVNSLLDIAEVPVISRRNALKIVSILSNWTNSNKIALAEFEEDPRFLKLCKFLGRNVQNSKESQAHRNFGDLAIILGLTGDDEAAKLISNITLHQMIKVMSTLAQQRKRSTPLLRSLAFNISSKLEKLDIKQAADLLYSMAVLNFPDEVLLQKTSSDLLEAIPSNDKSAVISSISTSLGLLRYKDVSVLDSLCEWVVAHPGKLRPQDLASLLLTLATVAHTPANAQTLFKESIEPLKQNDLLGIDWLDIVWSLVVLGQATPQHISTVLDGVFIQKLLESPNFTVTKKFKLLNINAAAQLLVQNYKGPLLDVKSKIFEVPLKRSKERQTYVKVIVESLSNLLPSATYLSTNVNTDMGFILDAECYVDAKCNPVPIDQSPEKDRKATRIAVVAMDYHDLCRGRQEPSGIISLSCKLLEAKGYRVMAVPHTEFSPRETLVTRVQYLEQQIKSIVKQSRT